ncbi:hypothetical protein [Clostridium beijerinckii]|uniref:hypothetical protein n=1 Tax=Clostridium beijerinckii TaxID=1520 RepID=UPI0012D349C1|nr:hypothetical protein [Clostridium beijerinckii]
MCVPSLCGAPYSIEYLVVGCGQSSKTVDENILKTSTKSTTITTEEAFTTISENNLVDDYFQDTSLLDKALLHDGIAYINLYFRDKMDERKK